MNKVILLLAVTFTALSCVKNNVENNSSNLVARLTTTEEFTVPYISGKTTYVTLGIDTIAIVNQPGVVITVPKSTSATKAESDIVVTYKDGSDPNAGTWQMWQTIAFEDTKSGDYDYNDIVIHTKYVTKGNNWYIGIHPIALGSVNNIQLGCRIYNGKNMIYDNIVISDCRAELFDGREGFLNTKEEANFYSPLFKKVISGNYTTSDGALLVIWYIVSSGNTLYSVNDKYGIMLDKNSRPYGLVITDTKRSFSQNGVAGVVGRNWFAYPLESNNISSCYPTFDSWLNGTIASVDFLTYNKVFDIENQMINGNRIYEISTKEAKLPQ